MLRSNWPKVFAQPSARNYDRRYCYAHSDWGKNLFTNNIIISIAIFGEWVEKSRERKAREAPLAGIQDRFVDAEVWISARLCRLPLLHKHLLSALIKSPARFFISPVPVMFKQTGRSCGWDNIKLIKWTFLSLNACCECANELQAMWGLAHIWTAPADNHVHDF